MLQRNSNFSLLLLQFQAVKSISCWENNLNFTLLLIIIIICLYSVKLTHCMKTNQHVKAENWSGLISWLLHFQIKREMLAAVLGEHADWQRNNTEASSSFSSLRNIPVNIKGSLRKRPQTSKRRRSRNFSSPNFSTVLTFSLFSDTNRSSWTYWLAAKM